MKLSSGEFFFSFKGRPLSRREAKSFERVASPEGVTIPLKR